MTASKLTSSSYSEAVKDAAHISALATQRQKFCYCVFHSTQDANSIIPNAPVQGSPLNQGT